MELCRVTAVLIREVIYRSALKSKFPEAETDADGAKAISISGGSLRRKIDIVPANWYDTNAFAHSQAKRDRAIQVLDNKTGLRIKNQPFLHNYLIDIRDKEVGGGLRKVVRLMKSLKYDSDNISLSSYDLTSIGYNMPVAALVTQPNYEIALLSRLKVFLDHLVIEPTSREAMMVPDGSRKVFAEGHATLQGLDQLRDEVDELVEAVRLDLQKSFAKLAEARVAY